jgi:hypothetical protein
MFKGPFRGLENKKSEEYSKLLVILLIYSRINS